DRYGVEEYYVYDPDARTLKGWQRRGAHLEPLKVMPEWVSPRMRIRFDTSGGELRIFAPDGQEVLSNAELVEELATEREERERAEKATERERAAKERGLWAEERERAAKEKERAAKEKERRRADRLAELLRAHGIDPGSDEQAEK